MSKLIRYRLHGTIHFGELRQDTIQPLEGPFGELRPSTEATVKLADVTLLAPTCPTKIISVGPNYAQRVPGLEHPMYWTKPATCANDPEGTIEIPPGHPAVNHEVELAIVIGRRAKMVAERDAAKYILGYTCMNDVTAGDFSKEGAFMASHYFVDGKIFDGFAPLGPWIETDLDTDDLQMECRVNGKVRQSVRTSERFFNPAQLVALLSNIMTLLPGDVISTGSPPGVAPIVDGDIVEVEIEKIGTLRNHARNRAPVPG